MIRLLVVCLAALPVFAQQGDLSLGGIVVNSKTGEPIKRAKVTITGFATRAFQAPGGAQPVNPGPLKPQNHEVFTDSSGEFHFTGLTAGSYNVNAQKPEFTPDFDPANPPRAIELSASVSSVRVALSPLGVITGKIVDQDGLPEPGINVVCLTSQVQDGQRQVRADRNVTTDDRGVYRFWNLAPGRYYVKAAGNGGGTAQTIGDNNGFTGDEAFAPAYFGGGNTLASAMPIEIGPGAEISADFAINVEPAFRVRGTLGNFVSRHAVTFQLRTGDDDVSAIRATVNGETGRFQLITPVVPGTYVLRATQDANVAEAPLTVRAADTNEVSMVLSPPVDIPVETRFAGTPVTIPTFEGRQTGSCVPQLHPTSALAAADALPAIGRFGRNSGDNPLPGVQPGRYRVSIGCFGAWARSAVSGTHDLAADPVLDIQPGATPAPIEILAAYGGGSIKGKISYDGETPLTGLTVLLVPQFSSVAGSQVAFSFRAPGQQGYQFQFSNLAPGSYTLRAFTHQDIEFRNPEFLRSLPGGVTVQIDGDAVQEVTIDGVIQ